MKQQIKQAVSALLQETFPYIKRKFSNTSTLYETFIDQNYKWLCANLKPDTVAIDIGANIGDSAIYLAMHNEIKKVIAFEPFPSLYSQAMENVKRAGFSDKVQLNNKGVGGAKNKIHIPKGYTADVYSSAARYKKRSDNEGIEITTLDDLLGSIKSKNIIIKCDCEGDEERIFNGHNKLGNVYKMQIEYHGGPKDLPDRIRKQGFKVELERVEEDLRRGECGWIYASR